MLRRCSRMHRSHVHTRAPRSTAGDHVSGGGVLGAGAPHAWQAGAGPAWAGTAGTTADDLDDLGSVTAPG